MGIFTSFFGFKSRKNESELINLISNPEPDEDWKDLTFAITEYDLRSSRWVFVCKAIYESTVVGFKFSIEEGIPAGIMDKKLIDSSFCENAGQIESIGAETDALGMVMSQLYEQPKCELFTHKNLVYTIFPLNRDRAYLKSGLYKFKLFYQDPELYSEFYINIDLPKRILEFKEKDFDYRKNIIDSFRK